MIIDNYIYGEKLNLKDTMLTSYRTLKARRSKYQIICEFI